MIKEIPIEISARHIHLSQEDLNKLFGENYKLQILKELSQPGQFAAKETVDLKTDKAELKNVRILGPIRSLTQIELSKTEARSLGIPATYHDSEELELSGTPGVEVVGPPRLGEAGPQGSIMLNKGVILAWRHLHVSPREAEELGIKDGELIKIETDGPRGLIFKNVLVRVNDKYRLSFQLDTDEGNAAGIEGGATGRIYQDNS